MALAFVVSPNRRLESFLVFTASGLAGFFEAVGFTVASMATACSPPRCLGWHASLGVVQPVLIRCLIG